MSRWHRMNPEKGSQVEPSPPSDSDRVKQEAKLAGTWQMEEGYDDPDLARDSQFGPEDDDA